MSAAYDLYKAAEALQSFLWNNAGNTADWPVDLVCRDEASAVKLQELLNAHREAIEWYSCTENSA